MDVSGQLHVRAALFLRYPLNRTVAGRRTLVGSLKKVGGKTSRTENRVAIPGSNRQ